MFLGHPIAKLFALKLNIDGQFKSLKSNMDGQFKSLKKIIEETNLLLDNGIHPNESCVDMETDLSTNLELLNVKRKVLENLNDKIWDLLEVDEETWPDMNESGDFQRYILKTAIRIEKYLKQNLNESSICIEKPASKSNFSVSAKLPKLTLPKYSGNPMTFQPLWDSFNSAIHYNQILNDIGKFNFLTLSVS